MREITFEKPVSKEETLQIECAINLGSEREREIVFAARDVPERIVWEQPTADVLEFSPANDEEWDLFALALRVFVPKMEAHRAAETH
jgi:hypothetical protein